MKREPKACPICGSPPGIISPGEHGATLYSVGCDHRHERNDSCRMNGPACESLYEAVENWNCLHFCRAARFER